MLLFLKSQSQKHFTRKSNKKLLIFLYFRKEGNQHKKNTSIGSTDKSFLIFVSGYVVPWQINADFTIFWIFMENNGPKVPGKIKINSFFTGLMDTIYQLHQMHIQSINQKVH